MLNRLRKFIPALIVVLTTAAGVFAEPDPAARTMALRWPGGSLRLAVSSSLFKQNYAIKPQSDISGALGRAIAGWEEVANVSILTANSDRQSVSPSGLKGDGVSLVTIASTPENILMFGSDTTIAAKSRLFVDAKGNITEADIVMSPFVQFSTDGSFGTFDLETVLSHEIGHALGLRHSPVLGSLMYENVDPNGSYLLGASSRRELSFEDIAIVRALYGVNESVVDCCGAVSFRLTGGKDILRGLIVLNDSHGRVAGTATISSTKEATISGLSTGRYTAFFVDPRHQFGDKALGEVSVEAGEVTPLTAKVRVQARAADIQFVGDRGILGTSPVVFAPGAEETLLIGGKDLAAGSLEFYTGAAGVRLDTATAENFDYSEQVSAIGVRVTVSENAKPGSYSIFVRSRNGAVSTIPGAIIIARR